MSHRLFKDRAHEILTSAGIKDKSAAYNILRSTVEDLVKELSKMTPKEQKNFAITAVQIYERFIKAAYDAQHKTLTESPKPAIEPKKFHEKMPLILKKIAYEMANKNSDKFSIKQLNDLFGTKAGRVEDLLKFCPLMECNQEGCYQFKSELRTELQNYYIALALVNGLNKKTSPASK